MIKVISFISISLALIFSISCSSKSEWVETEATIVNVKKLEDGLFSYTIRYDVPKSKAIDKEGKKIIGPIEQHSINMKEPLQQKLRIKYMLDEPIIFELIDEIKFKQPEVVNG